MDRYAYFWAQVSICALLTALAKTSQALSDELGFGDLGDPWEAFFQGE